MSGTPTADPAVQVTLRGSANEEVILARFELDAAGFRRERAEGVSERLDSIGVVAHGDHFGVGVGDAAHFVLFPLDEVDDELLGGPPRALIMRANDRHLIEFVQQIAVINVHVDNVVGVVDAEDGVGRVPMNGVNFRGFADEGKTYQRREH